MARVKLWSGGAHDRIFARLDQKRPGSSDLDVHVRRFLSLRGLQRRFLGGRFGMVDGLEILVDRIRRRLGVLVDNELDRKSVV